MIVISKMNIMCMLLFFHLLVHVQALCERAMTLYILQAFEKHNVKCQDFDFVSQVSDSFVFRLKLSAGRVIKFFSGKSS